MKPTIALKLISFGFIIAASASSVYGQEYFSNITTPTDLAEVTPDTAAAGAPEPYTNPAERVDISTPGLPPEAEGADKYNMALGPVHFSVAAGIGFEYNDNVNLAPSGQQQSDFAIIPSLTLDSVYQFSELNTLRFSLGLSYQEYLDHSQYDTRGLLISPNSALAFTVHLGNVALTFRDRFSYQEDPFDLPVLSGVAEYRRFENQVGVQADWAVNANLTVTGGYDHYNLWTLDSYFASLQHSVDTIFLKPSYAFTPALKVGVSASVSYVSFTEDIQNGGTNILVGPFTDIAITDNTHLYAEAGFQGFEFDHSGTIDDQSNANTWYARADLSNRLTESVSQRLSFTKMAEVGFGTNYYDIYHLEYAADWKIMQNLTFDPSIFFEHYTTSTPVGTEADSANRYGTSLGLRYIITPSVTVGLDYRYLYNASNISFLDYRQNLVMMSLYYNF